MTQDPGIQVSIALKLTSALAFGWLFKPQAKSRPQQCRWQTTLASPFGPPQPWRS
jgi:hypothetical protein